MSQLFLPYLFFFYSYGDHRDLHVLPHSFPTRRSSDLRQASGAAMAHPHPRLPDGVRPEGLDHLRRSEEHTSELQSLMRISYAVFCLKTKKERTQEIAQQRTYAHLIKLIQSLIAVLLLQ